MIVKGNDILVLGAHPDDIEFGMGGYLYRLQRNNNLHVIIFSQCKKSNNEDLCQEVAKSMDILGITSWYIKNIPVRCFPEYRQNILDFLFMEKGYDYIFSPSFRELHQDHSTLGMEVIRAFQDKSVIQYEILWNKYETKPNMFVILSQEELKTKIDSIRCYESQKDRFDLQQLISGLSVRAMQIRRKKRYSESFEIINLIEE